MVSVRTFNVQLIMGNFLHFPMGLPHFPAHFIDLFPRAPVDLDPMILWSVQNSAPAENLDRRPHWVHHGEMKSGASVPLRQADRTPIASPAFPDSSLVEKSGVPFFVSRGEGQESGYMRPAASGKSDVW